MDERGNQCVLQRLKDKGCHLYLRSIVGVEYARAVAGRRQLSELFEGFAAKPDSVIDDMPSTAIAPFIFNVHDEASWPSMAERTIRQHID